MIKKELDHFMIHGRYGGNQEWMLDPWMRLGGCGALAAVDSCIYFSRHMGVKHLIPEAGKIDKCRYRQLAAEMKPYLSPRFMGINKLSIYVDSFQRFLRERKLDFLEMEAYPMGGSKDRAWERYKGQIDADMLVPVLLLQPISKEWKEYQWHWFLLNGYEENSETGERRVKVVTYGAYEWLHFDTFWDELDKDNGGMILYSMVK